MYKITYYIKDKKFEEFFENYPTAQQRKKHLKEVEKLLNEVHFVKLEKVFINRG